MKCTANSYFCNPAFSGKKSTISDPYKVKTKKLIKINDRKNNSD